jgi:hypothetical protein
MEEIKRKRRNLYSFAACRGGQGGSGSARAEMMPRKTGSDGKRLRRSGGPDRVMAVRYRMCDVRTVRDGTARMAPGSGSSGSWTITLSRLRSAAMGPAAQTVFTGLGLRASFRRMS